MSISALIPRGEEGNEHKLRSFIINLERRMDYNISCPENYNNKD